MTATRFFNPPRTLTINNNHSFNSRFPVLFPSSNKILVFHPSTHKHKFNNKKQPSFPGCASSFPIISSPTCSDMDTSPGQGLYPLHRCKTIHLVRHAQGFHNVAGEKDHSAYLSPELFDAQLTPLGWKQVDNLQKHVHASGLSDRIELVVVSPLLRTMLTAVGVFGGEGYVNGVDGPPLMVENAGDSNRPAISSLKSPPFVANEFCREHVGVHWCDKRRSIRDYKSLFPAIDFSLIGSDDDVMWKVDVREANEDLAARGVQFFNWLWTREEKEIAVVTHSGFLVHTLNEFGNDCHTSVKSEICRPPKMSSNGLVQTTLYKMGFDTNEVEFVNIFTNCELRSVVIVDKRMIGTDSSTTDYPGKIPRGPDTPSDDADEI